jgi:hypothetical protein
MGNALAICVILTVALLIAYYVQSDQPMMIRPGGAILKHGAQYSVGGTVYTFDASSVPPHRFGFVMPSMQFESVLLKIREMTSRVFGALGDRAWLSGTSLLAFVRGGTVSPSDNVLHLNMLFSDRKVLFSSEMHTQCRAQFGLEINIRRGVESGRFITLTMLEDKSYEVSARVQFVAEAGHNTLAVVNSWHDDAVELCTHRRWPRNWILPISKETIDTLNVSLPAKPEFVIFKEAK